MTQETDIIQQMTQDFDEIASRKPTVMVAMPAICLTISLITIDSISIISANYSLHPAYPKISRHW